MTRIVLQVPGMSCDHCRAAINHAVGELAGVQAVAVDLEAKQVIVDGTAPLQAICAAIDDAGYEVAPAG